jgi:predicted DNA binding protein
MLTVTLEFRTEDLVPLGILPEGLFEKFESVELLETLRLERGWRLQLLKVRRRGPMRSDRELERESRHIRREYGLQSFEVVERRPRSREYILLVRQKNPPALERILALAGGGIAPIAPFRIDEERVLASFHGEAGPLRRVLARLEREGLPFRILRSSARPFGADAGDRELTTRQRTVLARAWALGYFAVPRRISLTRLASVTGQSPPALGKMLRRAQGTLITRFLASEAMAANSEGGGESGPWPQEA